FYGKPVTIELIDAKTKEPKDTLEVGCGEYKPSLQLGNRDVESGATLDDDYFSSRLPIVMKRIAPGRDWLAMILNRVFGNEDTIAAT
ncbi:hypothetical protein U1Q18_008252, partial [Sarracenia purpurea var. burkii]